MTLTLEQINGMELLWNEFPKKQEGDSVRMTIYDIDAFWNMGIVDTKQHSIEVWRQAFDGHKQPDGTYLLTKADFMEKEKYRYKGEIMVPFDAMRINEGKYTNEGLQELFDQSIAPSCSYGTIEMKRFFDDLKAEFRDSSGMIKIGKDAKIKIRNLIDKNPSPLRRLELVFDYLFKQARVRGDEFIKKEIEPKKGAIPYLLSPEQLAKVQASSFSMNPVNDTEVKATKLRSIQKTVQKKEAKAEKPTTTLKKVKRSRKGVRG